MLTAKPAFQLVLMMIFRGLLFLVSRESRCLKGTRWSKWIDSQIKIEMQLVEGVASYYFIIFSLAETILICSEGRLGKCRKKTKRQLRHESVRGFEPSWTFPSWSLSFQLRIIGSHHKKFEFSWGGCGCGCQNYVIVFFFFRKKIGVWNFLHICVILPPHLPKKKHPQNTRQNHGTLESHPTFRNRKGGAQELDQRSLILLLGADDVN